MIQYLWNAPLFDLAYDPRIEENLTVTIISSALESQRKSFKLQSILARQFSQVSILPRAFLHCSWVKELMSVMHNVFWNIPFFKKKIHDFYILDSYYIKQEPSFSFDRFYCKRIRISVHFLTCAVFLTLHTIPPKACLFPGKVAEMFLRVRELDNRISKISIFLNVSQDICYWSSTCLLSLFCSNQRMRVGRKKTES